ncbi:hypothetical protein ABIA24_001284 [Sinorhizobium fredii]
MSPVTGRQMAVVDKDRRACGRAETLAERCHHGIARRSSLEDRAFGGRLRRCRQQGRIDTRHTGGKGQFVIGIEPDHAFAETLCGSDELANRYRVEKLVCREKQEAGRQAVEACVPMDLAVMAGKRFGLHLAQPFAGFDEMDVGGRVETGRQAADDTQDIRHHRAAARADFGDDNLRRGAVLLPGMNQEYADHFPEELADLGRGREVAGPSEGLANAIVAVLRVR